MWLLLLWVAYVISNATVQSTKPNIVVILADDMGWNDVGFHGHSEIPTPNIDALAYNGVILNSHYTQALCTPSRAAFLTGKYPIHLGMQHMVILEREPWGLPLNETILPQRLKRHGYKTHAVGKWHLGFYKKEHTPTYRGFDSHYGYWQGFHDYYDHTVKATFTPEIGYDMRRNMSVDWDAQGKYSTTLFTKEAVQIIEEHEVKHPLFMYFAHLAPHAANHWEPFQAPDEEVAKFSYIEDPERRTYAAMVSLLDKSVGDVVEALSKKRMLENTIIIFMSDNGGSTVGIYGNKGSNHPLRGMKNSPFEGGMRCIAAVWSPLIKKPRRVSNELMHISDWIPTLYSAIGLNQSELGLIDGINMWPAISDGHKGRRLELLYNIDEVWKYGAIRRGHWKYLYGSVTNEDLWYGTPDNSSVGYSYSIEDVVKSKAAVSIAGALTRKQIRKEIRGQLVSTNEALNLKDKATVRCSSNTKANEMQTPTIGRICNPSAAPCLFNLEVDPCETDNLIDEHPDIAKKLRLTLEEYRKTALPIINTPSDPKADPTLYNGTWVNWQDYAGGINVKEKATINALSPLAVCLIAATCVLFLITISVLVTIWLKKDRKGKYRNVHGELNEPDK